MTKTLNLNPISLVIIGILFNFSVLMAQSEWDIKETQIVNSILKSTFGQRYETDDFFELDSALVEIKQKNEEPNHYFFNDPYNQLKDCIIASYCKWDSTGGFGSGEAQNDSGAIAIIRDNKVIWHSRNFIVGYNEVASRIIGFTDVDNDGRIDIICLVGSGTSPYTESLWIISTVSNGGKVLNDVNEFGYSIIQGASDSFEFIRSNNSKLKEIRALDPESDELKTITYIWNGKKVIRK